MESTLDGRKNWTKMLSTICITSVNTEDLLECLHNGADPNALHTGKAPIHLVAELGRADFLKILLENGAKPSKLARGSESVLHCLIRAVKEGQCEENDAVKCIKVMNQYRHVINLQNEHKETPIYLAIQYKLWSIVAELIISGACIDYMHENKLIRELIQEEKQELVEHVPKTEAISSVYQMGFELLTSGNENEFVNEFLNLYDMEHNINERWYLGHTLLQVATRHNLMLALTKLLQLGADPNIYSDFGWTALHIAVECNNKQSCKILLQHGCNVDDKTAFRNETALHLAAKRNKNDIIKLLIDYKANIFIKNSDNVPVFTLLDHDIINEYLDKKITARRSNNLQDSGAVTFDYSFLILNNSNTNDLFPEMECLLMLAILPKYWLFLKHPVIRSFLFLKWFRIYWLYYIQLILYIIVVSLLTASVYLDTQTEHNNHNEHVVRHTIFTILFCIVVWEIIKIIMLPITYFTNIGKLFEIGIYVLIISIHIFHTSLKFRQNISILIILLAMILLTFEIGKHPRFAVYITIFLAALKRTLQFCLLIIPFFLAFVYAFHVHFYECNNNTNNNSNQTIIHPKCKNSTKYFNSVLRTIVMTQGEFNIDKITFTKFSYFIFLLFIFFIVIIIINILTALVINDTKNIMKNFELINYVAQIYLYNKIETVLLGAGHIMKCCRFCRIRPIKQMLRKYRYSIASKILLLSGRLPNQSLHIIFGDPNRMEPNIIDPCRVRCFKYLIHADYQCVTLMEVNNSYVEFHEFINDSCRILSKRERKSDVDVVTRRIEKAENSLSVQLKQRDDTIVRSIQLQKEYCQNIERRFKNGLMNQLVKLQKIENKLSIKKRIKIGKNSRKYRETTQKQITNTHT